MSSALLSTWCQLCWLAIFVLNLLSTLFRIFCLHINCFYIVVDLVASLSSTILPTCSQVYCQYIVNYVTYLLSIMSLTYRQLCRQLVDFFVNLSLTMLPTCPQLCHTNFIVFFVANIVNTWMSILLPPLFWTLFCNLLTIYFILLSILDVGDFWRLF